MPDFTEPLGGLPIIWEECLQVWHKAATREDTKSLKNWGKVVSLVQAEFWDGTLAEECAWKMVILILKGGGDFRWIGLVELLWNTVTCIFNQRFTMAIGVHDSLHRFWAIRGNTSL